MIVRELIALLQDMPQDKQVEIEHDPGIVLDIVRGVYAQGEIVVISACETVEQE